jgi:hypothetical protein
VLPYKLVYKAAPVFTAKCRVGYYSSSLHLLGKLFHDLVNLAGHISSDLSRRTPARYCRGNLPAIVFAYRLVLMGGLAGKAYV